jgi:hypothetical protein
MSGYVPTPAMIEAGMIPLREISGFEEKRKLAEIFIVMYDVMIKEKYKGTEWEVKK